MDEDLILHEIVKSLAFEIEAVNQDNVLKWSSTNGTPLNVKVRVRNKDEPRLIQRGAIPVPRIAITAPEKLRLISSDQTILSFNVYLEGDLQKDPKREKKFNIRSCLGTYSDDEGPYLPGSSEQNALESDSCSKSGSDILKKNVSPVLNSTNSPVPRNQKTFFGKCKPGGCLDPPFDEENYAYRLSNSDRNENIKLVLNKIEDNTKTCEPGGCLDPPSSEDKYPYTNPRVQLQEKLGNKFSKERVQRKTKDKKTIKNQEDSKNLMDVYARISKEDSIITYPTDVSSNETLYDQIPNKKISIKSNDDEAQKQSYEYPVSYFVPPKDISRNKDDERRYSRRLSSDAINRSSNDTEHDEANKTKNTVHDMPQNALCSKGTLKENVETDTPHNALRSNSIHEEKLETGMPHNALRSKGKHEQDLDTDMPHNALRSKGIHKENLKIDMPHNALRLTGIHDENLDTDETDMPHNALSSNSIHEKLETGMPHNALRFKGKHEVNLRTDDIASKSYHENENEKKNVTTEKENPDPDSAMETPPYVLTDPQENESYKTLPSGAVYKEYSSRDLTPTESNANHEIQQSQQQTASTTDSDKSNHVKPGSIEENVKKQNWQTKRDTPIAKGADKGMSDILPQSETNFITSPQTKESLDAPREKLDTDTIQQLELNQKKSETSKAQSPIKGNNKSNYNYDNDDGVSKIIPVAEATIPILATTTFGFTEKQSIKHNDKPNIELDSSMINKESTSISKICSEDSMNTTNNKEKLQSDHDEFNYVSPQRMSSSENNEFDVSSGHSIDSKNELSNKVKPLKLEEILGQKGKQQQKLLAETLNSNSLDNVIIGKNEPKDYIKVDPGSQTKRTSEILIKKPFKARHNVDIEQDDINKTAPLKRKTFTVISSNTSLQKREEIEELPQNTTDIYFKTTDKSRFGSRDSVENSTHISDTNYKNPEDEISPSQKSVPVKTNDFYSNTTPTTTIKKIKEMESTLKTNLDENQPHILSENVTNINPTNNQTKPLDSLPSENNIRNPFPVDVQDIQTNIVGDRESALTNRSYFKTERLETMYRGRENTYASYKDIESLHKPEITQDLHVISDNANNLDTGNQFMEKLQLNRSSKYSLQNTYNDNGFHVNDNVSDKSAAKQETENEALGKRESEKMLNIDSNIFVPNEYTDNLRSKTVTNSKLVTDSIKDFVPENTKDLYPKINIDDKSASFTENHKQHEFIAIKDVEMNNSNTGIDISLLPLKDNRHIDDSVDSASDRIYLYKNYENSKLDATQVVKPEQVFVQDYDYDTTYKANDKTERNDLGYRNLDKTKYQNSIPNITPPNEEYFISQTADDKNYDDIDQIYDKYELLDTRLNDNPVQVELTENISDRTNLKKSQDTEDRNNELIKERESFTKYSSLSGGYSGLISGVLSNISENKEDEEKKYENIVQFDPDVSRGHEAIDDKFTTISGESESNYKLPTSIKGSVSTLKEINRHMNKETKPEARKNITSSFDRLKQRSDTYETDSAKLNVSRDGVFLDKITGIIDQPSEYQSSQILASIHDLIGVNQNNSSAKPVSLTGSSKHYKQTNLTKLKVEEKSHIVETESTSLRDISPLYLDMSFCSYVNDNKQRIVQTQSSLIEPQTPVDGTVTIVKTLIRHGHEIRIPVDNDNDITLNVLGKDLKVQVRSSNVGLPMSQNRREKHFVDRSKRQNDILNKNLSLIYESELIPLHTVIKDLTQEVNKLATKQETLQMRMRNIKRSKSLRLIPVLKRCGCRRI